MAKQRVAEQGKVAVSPGSRVWVLVDHRGGKLADGSLEAVSEGRKVADKMGQHLAVVLLDELPGEQMGLLARHGAGRILTIARPGTGESVESDVHLLAAAIQQGAPDIVLTAHTIGGADMASRLAAHLGTGLVTCCDRVDVDEDGLMAATKAVYGGKASATFVGQGHRPQMATINPDAVEVRTPYPAATAEVVSLPVSVDLPEPKSRVVDFIKGDPRSVPLTEAGIVVAGGKGLGSGDNFKLVADLADAIGGSVAASRPAVDEEWIGRERQVGLTGKTVRPRLYIACGISGAIQHTMGMKDAATIVAINTDRDAPIFKLADVCVVGDVLEVLPALTARLRQVRGNGPGRPDLSQVVDAVSKG